MAELSAASARLVIGMFLRAYNIEHGSAYVLTRAEPADDHSCDYLCTDPQRAEEPLKVQLTQPPTTVKVSMPDGSVQEISMHEVLHRRDLRHRSLGRWGTAAGLVVEAVARKSMLGDSARDLVLVVFFDLKRYDEDIDLPGMRSAAHWAALKAEESHGTRFREIWAVWDFEDEHGAAHCLWPASSEKRATSPSRVIRGGTTSRWEDFHHGVDPDGVEHVLSVETEDAICGACLIDTRSGNERCPQCDLLLREDVSARVE